MFCLTFHLKKSGKEKLYLCELCGLERPLGACERSKKYPNRIAELGQPVTREQLSVIGDQLSVVGCQLSVSSYQLSSIPDKSGFPLRSNKHTASSIDLGKATILHLSS